MADTLLAHLTNALDLAVFRGQRGGALLPCSPLPHWYHRLVCPTDHLPDEAMSPFLEYFLAEADDFWHRCAQGEDPQELDSGVWTEVDEAHREHHLKASAHWQGGQPLLLIQRAERQLEEQRSILQKARERSLEYESLVREVQKKELLLATMAHGLIGHAAAARRDFTALEVEPLTPSGKRMVERGHHHASEQESLIRAVLRAFSSELDDLEKYYTDADRAPCLAKAVNKVAENIEASFAAKGVDLDLFNAGETRWAVVGESERLERVVSSLLENALRRCPLQGRVAVKLRRLDDSIRVEFTDPGPPVPAAEADALLGDLSRWRPGGAEADAGLFASRLTIERWGGSVGCEAAEDGEWCFWFQLPVADEPPAAGDGPAGRKRPVFKAGETVAGRYEIIRFLGQGGMGAVFAAHDRELDRKVALKTILPHCSSSPSELERFKREIALSHRISHNNVCRVFDLFQHRRRRTDGSVETIFFLTMELLNGEPLTKVVSRCDRGRMSTSDALPIVRQMAAALDAAHAQGIVHRDFKTDNVFVEPGESKTGSRVVVIDYGVARAREEGEPTGQASSGVEIVGTPVYMAPEQLEGAEVTPAADIYALGIVMYQMVTGRFPYPGGSPLAVAANRLARPPTPPDVHRPDLDPAWTKAILRCLEREPVDRFPSGAEMVRALTEQTNPGSLIDRASRHLRRLRKTTGANEPSASGREPG